MFSRLSNLRPVLLLLIVFIVLIFFLNFKNVASPFMKGMTISTQTWGGEWATPQMKEAMSELKTLGVDWIAIHPYARIREDGTIRFRNDVDYHITTPLKYAKELGMKIMLKPHLAYWGTKFDWRGDIDFNDSSDWERFFYDYQKWIVHLANIAQEYDSDMFCIGLEYRNSYVYEDKWRSIISAVREKYQGPVTYGANWDSYREVNFWDALDYIGIQAYFPLTEKDYPTEEELSEGWNKVFQDVIPYASGLGKQVIFTEIGYNSSHLAARKPWSDYQSSTSPTALLNQQSCVKVALNESAKEKYIAGLFLWKWFPERQRFRHHRNYNLQTPEMKNVIKEMWR